MEFTNRLITSVNEKIQFVLQRVHQLRLLRYPSRNPDLLISMFFRILDKLTTKLNNYQSEYIREDSDDRRKQLLDEIYLTAALVMHSIAPHLRYIEGASVERTPWSLVEPLEKLAQNLLEGTRFIVRPQWHYNFGILEIVEYYKKSLARLLSDADLDTIFADLPDRLYIISFPGFERANVLLHVNLGHEIGHPIQSEFFSNEEKSYLIDIRNKVASLLTEEDEVTRMLRASEIAQRVAEVRRRALEEIMADLFSLHLFGPAAIFALYDVASCMGSFDNIPEAPGYYPPWRMRLRTMLGEMNWSELWKCVEDIAKEDIYGVNINTMEEVKNTLSKKMEFLNSLADVTKDQVDIQNEPILSIAYEAVESALPSAKQFLIDKFGSHRLIIDNDFCRNIVRLVARLNNGIPPNEYLESENELQVANLQVILNAGWLYKMAFLSSMYSDDDGHAAYFENLEVLNRLVLKAIETSDLQREYATHKNEKPA